MYVVDDDSLITFGERLMDIQEETKYSNLLIAENILVALYEKEKP